VFDNILVRKYNYFRVSYQTPFENGLGASFTVTKFNNAYIVVIKSGGTGYAVGSQLKVLGSLDQFVRENMLEESKIEDDFQKLRSHYQTLLDIHRNMQKAEKQLELLKPVKVKSEELEKTKTALEKLSSLRETSPIYFFKNKENFLTREIEKEALELKRITDKEIELKIEIDTDREAEKILDSDIRNDETGKQILELEKEIKSNKCLMI
jgi:uncharacterized protein YPO0396